MKNHLLLFSSLVAAFQVSAQSISVPEPELLHGYIHLTSDSTFNALPKERGEFKKHESKLSKFAKVGSAVAGAAGAVGAGMMGLGGSVGTVVAGARTITTAASVSSAVGTLDLLSGMEGMDIVFSGKESSYTVSANEPMRFIVREADNLTDPLDIMRVVQLKKGKKDRKIRWMNLSSSLLGGEEATKKGYLQFSGEKYGESSYLITIPQGQLEAGEYGIIIGNEANATVIPVATFSVR